MPAPMANVTDEIPLGVVQLGPALRAELGQGLPRCRRLRGENDIAPTQPKPPDEGVGDLAGRGALVVVIRAEIAEDLNEVLGRLRVEQGADGGHAVACDAIAA